MTLAGAAAGTHKSRRILWVSLQDHCEQKKFKQLPGPEGPGSGLSLTLSCHEAPATLAFFFVHLS